jgi:hypothetical protein
MNLVERDIQRAKYLMSMASPEERPFEYKYRGRAVLEKLLPSLEGHSTRGIVLFLLG